jgi:hypothetical protein
MALRPGGMCLVVQVVYIYTSHSQFEHDKRDYTWGAGNLNIRIHRDITGEMWFGVRQ